MVSSEAPLHQRDDARSAGPESLPSRFLGRSAAARQVRDLIRRAARVDSTVLITGESGVGKELVAREIHDRSSRAGRPFLPLNCAAIPEGLVESEMFGHEPGAFTGAKERHKGVFELSTGGTLFLDEVGDLSLSAQPKLLRVLETGELIRVGGERPQPVDLRIIAATNHKLKAMVREKHFREDLYYRLCVFEIYVPPLRQRLEDIPLLARGFAEYHAHKMNRDVTLSEQALERLKDYRWPGNVRQLRHIVETALAMNSGGVLDVDCFDLDALSGPRSLSGIFDHEWRKAKEEFESTYVRRLLEKYDNNVTKAARAAGLARRSFYKILQRLGLQPERDSS